MKSSKLWSILMMLVLVLGGTTVFSSCGSDDDDNIVTSANSLLGLWEENGSTTDSYYRIQFKNDGTGVVSDEDGTRYFTYTYSYDSGTSKGNLKLWYNNSNTIYNYEVTITGNTMMLTRNGSTSVFKKK